MLGRTNLLFGADRTSLHFVHFVVQRLSRTPVARLARRLPRPPRDKVTSVGAGLAEDGRGWVRTSDLSRVKRALSH